MRPMLGLVKPSTLAASLPAIVLYCLTLLIFSFVLPAEYAEVLPGSAYLKAIIGSAAAAYLAVFASSRLMKAVHPIHVMIYLLSAVAAFHGWIAVSTVGGAGPAEAKAMIVGLAVISIAASLGGALAAAAPRLKSREEPGAQRGP